MAGGDSFADAQAKAITQLEGMGIGVEPVEVPVGSTVTEGGVV
jgi:hypothetical protein